MARSIWTVIVWLVAACLVAPGMLAGGGAALLRYWYSRDRREAEMRQARRVGWA